ncbi:hypothetical protein [Chitinophaga flava]|uniref:Cytochrome c oxidase subunit IV n=1 Tax=Chitinophaga flava TaxID=2259036 RepID=A0A365XZC0_9BACT|nr:hypothetical protein [Chitinophaga flava]RBL91697.1 hypothetical protein DF182_03555 [Chitinophaga flava]
MFRILNTTWILLMLAVAIMTAVVLYKQPLALIMCLSAIKFMLVAFNFMDMARAHTAWKTLLLLFIAILSLVVIVMAS